jgi:hypothetical protein
LGENKGKAVFLKQEKRTKKDMREKHKKNGKVTQFDKN